MESGKLRAVIFDLDGLLVDSESLYREAFGEAAAAFGLGVDAAFYERLVGRRTGEVRGILRETFGENFPLEAFVERWIGGFRERVKPSGAPPKPGARELLQWLDSRGIAAAVATSTPRDDAILTLGGLAGRFRAIVAGDEIERGKPEPDSYLEAARRLGVGPADCLALEDSAAGVEAAHRAGMRVILVPDLVPPPAEARARAWRICRDLHEVRERLARAAGTA